MAGTLLVIATPLGHLDDLSPRARAALERADCIACEDTRRTSVLLDRFGIDRPLVSCHKFNERARLEPLLSRLAEGGTVALVSDAGTPAIADPGARLVAAAIAAGHRVSPVPGPSAVTAMLSVSGFETDRFVFDGFLPHRGGERRRRLRRLRDEPRAIVLYETPHRIRDALADVAEIFGTRRVALGRELTKLHETILHGTAAELRDALGPAPKGEFVLVLAARADGDAAGVDRADELLDVWREEKEAAGGDTRVALRRAAKRLGLKRAELFRALGELGEPFEG